MIPPINDKPDLYVKRIASGKLLTWAITCGATILLVIRHVIPTWDIANVVTIAFEWLLPRLIFDVTTGILIIVALCPWWFNAVRRMPHKFVKQHHVSQLIWLKSLISIVAMIFLIVHTARPGIAFDYISLGLLIIAVLPWLTSLIESAKFPGGWEVKFRDIKEAGEKITSNEPEPSTTEIPAPSFTSVAQEDPNLAIVGLRIEIEKRILELADKYQIKRQRSLSRMSNELRVREILDADEMYGLQELIHAGNQAAHGARVESKVADWAIKYGPIVLGILDRKISEAPSPTGLHSSLTE